MAYNFKKGTTTICTLVDQLKPFHRSERMPQKMIEEIEEIIPSFLRGSQEFQPVEIERKALPHNKRLEKEHMHKHFGYELEEAKREEEGEEDVEEKEEAEERDEPYLSEDTIDYITFRVLQNVKKYLEDSNDGLMRPQLTNTPRFKIEIG